MNAPEPHPISSDSEQQMRETLALQRDSYIAEGEVGRHTYRQNSAHHRGAGLERRKNQRGDERRFWLPAASGESDDRCHGLIGKPQARQETPP